MADINFKYNYPYCGCGEICKYQTQWEESRTKINGSYTYPMVFNNTVPKCSHIKVSIEIDNTGSGTIYGLKWDFMVHRKNYGWIDVESFTMPDDGIYTIDCDIDNYNITKFAVVPASNPGSSRTWDSWFYVEELEITENIEIQELTTGSFQYGLFVNNSDLKQQVNEVYVNIDGVLKPVTDILVNIDDKLIPIQPVNSAYIKTTEEEMLIYSFIPETDGKYRITQKNISGDHEIRLYDSEFSPLYDGYFYSESFELTQGSLLYITVTHYYEEETGESYLQVYREE